MYIKSSIIFIVLFFIVEKRKLGIQRPFLRFSNVKNPKKKKLFPIHNSKNSIFKEENY